MTLDTREFRDVMGTFTTGVTIITTLENEMLHGITANSFTSVSLSPPLVMFCLGKSSTNFEFFMEADCFAVNILTEQQDSLSARFVNPDKPPPLRRVFILSLRPVIILCG